MACRNQRWQLFCFHAAPGHIVACHIGSCLGGEGQIYDILWSDTVYSGKSIPDFRWKFYLRASKFMAIIWEVMSCNVANGFRSNLLFFEWKFGCDAMWFGICMLKFQISTPSPPQFNGHRKLFSAVWNRQLPDASPPSRVLVKNEWSCTSKSPCAFLTNTETGLLFLLDNSLF